MTFTFDINRKDIWPKDIYGYIMTTVFGNEHPRLKDVGLGERKGYTTKSWKNHRSRVTNHPIFLPMNQTMPPVLLRGNKFTINLKNVTEAYELKRIDNFCEITRINL